ncbi:coiled-coil domain-containing protein 174 [Maniola hyperantus]|uniref:coiled-coil domain-containing protein 174 n=1 Tax=Aphantopus hyperantus TaxID=2795564 RepID=UPI001568289A|nr:coiled-coil domain-containing protein 174 isoform X1 [Maniola hyperantus]
MNEQTSKKILFNRSTLLSLKAELLKKQEEVQEKKHLPQHNLELFKPHQSAEKKNKSEPQTEKKSFKDKLKAVDVEEFEACRKAKLALEKKAELYEHLADGAGDSQLAGRFLVDFKGKKQEAVLRPEPEPEDEEEQVPYDDDQGEWVEFTDFLGRTRKCLKSDLEHYKKRDEQLMKIVTNEKPHQDSTDSEPQTSQNSEKPLLVQKTNDYLQSLREKWEQKEMELLSKDKDIHYQDLLFDEARIHGVGYYAFSTDETERREQMEELLKRRDETLKAQKQAEEQRKKRDELIAARVAAARARQRARAGLPPEDPEEKKKEFTACLLQFLTQQRDEADKKAKEEEKKTREEQEKERQKLRAAYVREWDLGKEGVEDKVKKFKEMTQEEYVEQQRAKRIDEFAPIQSTNSDDSMYVFDTQGRRIKPDIDINKDKTWSDVRRMKTPPPPVIGDLTDIAQKGLYFSTKKTEAMVKYKNFVKFQEPVPINNELSDEEETVNTRSKPDKRKDGSEYVEIEPPSTFDYYGPVPKHRKADKPFSSDLREAMAQGNKSLERKESNRRLPQHYDFTFD